MTAPRSMLRRFIMHILLVILFVLIAARFYKLGMFHFEGESRSFWYSLEVVFESLTSTGYGSDAPWSHPLMILYVIALQLSGLVLLFSLFPLYVAPFFVSRFEQRLPVEAPGMDGHVIVYRYSPAVALVLRELEKAKQPVLVIEEDEQESRRLFDDGHKIIHRVLDDEALLAAGLMRASAIVANGSDSANATLALAARQLGFTGKILTIANDPSYAEVLTIAGSTEVLAPRHLLAVALATRASEKVSPTLAGAHQLGEHLEVFQIRVQPDSRLAGLDLSQAGIGAKTGTVVIGQWVGGQLNTETGPSTVIQPGGLLVVAGSHQSIEKLIRLEAGTRPVGNSGPFVVVGNGEVGLLVVELLREAGEQVLVIDKDARPGVDLVGDILDPEIVSGAALEQAQGVILAISSDVSTLFATVILRDRCHGVPIMARVNDAENLEKIHRAGADFALSFSQVAGGLLVSKLLGRHAMELDPQLKLFKVSGQVMVGNHPAGLDIRARTGCSIVGVEHDGTLLTEFDSEFRCEENDAVFLCGSQQAVDAFQRTFHL